METKDWNVGTALEQIISCGFECEGGCLESNTAFIWLRKSLMSECPDSLLIDLSDSICASCGEAAGKFQTKAFHTYWDYSVICPCGAVTKYCSDPYCARDYYTGAL